MGNCSPEAYYYGIGVPEDPVKARKCAYLWLKHPEMAKGKTIFLGDAVTLMMIYLNGQGVDQNFDIALKCACIDAEKEGPFDSYVQTVKTLKENSWSTGNFDVCDEANANGTIVICAEREKARKEAKQKARLFTLTSRWRKADRKAFKRLERAFLEYVRFRVSNEVEGSVLMGGYLAASGVDALGEEGGLTEEFLTALERFERGEFPHFSEAEFKEADNVLKREFQQTLKALKETLQERSDGPPITTLSPEGIEDTQETWVEYRDAWVLFAKRHYPRATATSLKTWLTRSRKDALAGLWFLKEE